MSCPSGTMSCGFSALTGTGLMLTDDNSGNMVRKTVGIQDTRFIYDVEDRLVQVENEIGSVIAKYYYDPFWRRLWKEVDSVRAHYLYSDEGLIGEYG